jgi:hypothetical protein
MRTAAILFVVGLGSAGSLLGAEPGLEAADPIVVPDSGKEVERKSTEDFAAEGYMQGATKCVEEPGRLHCQVTKDRRGTTLPIPRKALVDLCSDLDGCEVRLGLYNWDNSGRVASRETLLYYNPINHAWRASYSDERGTNFDGVTAQVLSAWSCFFTDGTYRDWKNVGDGDLDFGLLSWRNDDLVSDCVLSLID